MRSTANLSLTVWDSNNDTFDHTALASNWDKIDADYNRTRPTNSAEVRTTVPSTANFEGRLVYLSAADGGFAAGTLIKYHGSAFAPVTGVEVLTALPTLGLFAGRMVLLSSASGGFAAWTMVRYDGSTWATISTTYELLSAVPVTSNFAGRMVMLTAANGGYNAYDLIRFNGTSWARIGPDPVYPGTEIVYTAISTDQQTINTVDPGDILFTFPSATYENVKYYFQIEIGAISHSVANATTSFRLIEGGVNQGNLIPFDTGGIGKRSSHNVLLPFTPSAGVHVFVVKWWTSTSGTATIGATGIVPTILRIFKA